MTDEVFLDSNVLLYACSSAQADAGKRRDILVKNVLPGWLKRCGPPCAQVWQQTLGPTSGIDPP